ncbi:hypothetical protein ACJX0J_041462, partial [Zea mays]
ITFIGQATAQQNVRKPWMDGAFLIEMASWTIGDFWHNLHITKIICHIFDQTLINSIIEDDIFIYTIKPYLILDLEVPPIKTAHYALTKEDMFMQIVDSDASILQKVPVQALQMRMGFDSAGVLITTHVCEFVWEHWMIARYVQCLLSIDHFTQV